MLSQKVNAKVASWVSERIKILDFRKLGNLKGISEMLELDHHYPYGQTKENFDICGTNTRKISRTFCRTSERKT